MTLNYGYWGEEGRDDSLFILNCVIAAFFYSHQLNWSF